MLTSEILRSMLAVSLICSIAVEPMPASAQADGTAQYPSAVIFVKGDAAGENNGSSWQNAFTKLQDALLFASSGDEIWVARGIYYPASTGQPIYSFILRHGVEVYGGFAGSETLRNERDWILNPTVLSGDIDQNDITDSRGVVMDTANIRGENTNLLISGSGTDHTTVLDGFIVTAADGEGSGGGLYILEGSPTISNSEFSGNKSVEGGGICIYNSYPTLTNVTFSGNAADLHGGGMFSYQSNASLNTVTFSGNKAVSRGGGMFNRQSSPTLSDVTFTANTTDGLGGGMYNDEGSNPTLTNVTFTGNTAFMGGGGMVNYSQSNSILNHVDFSDNSSSVDNGNGGGGVLNGQSNPTLADVTFSGNSSWGGGGMRNSKSSPTLINVTFLYNTASETGGGMFNSLNSSPSLTHVTFSGNSAINAGGMLNNSSSSPKLTNVSFISNTAIDQGGGMFNADNSSPTMINAIFYKNIAARGGAIINEWWCNPELINATFFENSATLSGGAIYNTSSSPFLTNSILWGDSAPEGAEIYNLLDSTPSIAYSDVQGGWSGMGNVNVDPLFVGPASGNLRLKRISPLINVGNNAAIPAGVTTDLEGNPRIFGEIVDIGAYESDVITASFLSSAVLDGWILESTEASGKGGTLNSTATTFNLGDDAQDRQYRAILSFNTGGLPNNAVITRVVLKIRKQGLVGTSPFNTHSGLKVDIRKIRFGTSMALQVSDFQAAASKSLIGTFGKTPVNNWYSATLAKTSFPYINLAGVTQFRLRFARDDNDDHGADHLKFFSGNAPSATRPMLVVTYYVP